MQKTIFPMSPVCSERHAAATALKCKEITVAQYHAVIRKIDGITDDLIKEEYRLELRLRKMRR